MYFVAWFSYDRTKSSIADNIWLTVIYIWKHHLQVIKLVKVYSSLWAEPIKSMMYFKLYLNSEQHNVEISSKKMRSNAIACSKRGDNARFQLHLVCIRTYSNKSLREIGQNLLKSFIHCSLLKALWKIYHRFKATKSIHMSAK